MCGALYREPPRATVAHWQTRREGVDRGQPRWPCGSRHPSRNAPPRRRPLSLPRPVGQAPVPRGLPPSGFARAREGRRYNRAMALPEATSAPATERPPGWRATWRDPKPRGRAVEAAEREAVERCEGVLAGPIPPPEALRDEALRTLLDLARNSGNHLCRLSAAIRLLEYSQNEISSQAFAKEEAAEEAADLEEALRHMRAAGTEP